MYFFVYTLQSIKDNKFYTGYSKNLKERIKQHSQGDVISTRNRRPLKLIHAEIFINESDARAREVYLKSGYGRQQLRKMLKNTLPNQYDQYN